MAPATADGNRHTHHDIPILVAGKGGGYAPDRPPHRYRRETPVNNLWLALLDRMGVPANVLGDSTGKLEGLS